MSSDNVNVKLFQKFMHAYSSLSGIKYSATLENVKSADAVIVVGTRIASDDFELYTVLESIRKEVSANIMYAHPIEDVAMKDIATQFMKYEPGSEEGVFALLTYYLLAKADLSKEEKNFLDNLDLAYLEAESNVGEEEFEEMIGLFENSNNKVLIIGSDILAHNRVENIARLCAIIEKYTAFSLLVLPREISVSDEIKKDDNTKLEDIDDLPEYNGTVIYHLNHIKESDTRLHGSVQFAKAAKISDGDIISIELDDLTISREFKLENTLKGTIALNPTFDIDVNRGNYRFERSNINKINQKSENNYE